MGFFDRLFWGSSRRFADDVTNNVTNTKKQKMRNKMEKFNFVSADFYERKIFVDDCKTLMVEVVNCFTEEEPDNEQEKVLIIRMADYYHTGRRQIEEKATVPVPPSVLSAYSDMLQQYNQALSYIEKFIKQRQWARSPELAEYFQQNHELLNRQISNDITQEEYSQALKFLKKPLSPLEGIGGGLTKIIRLSNESQQALAQTGEILLNKIK